MHCPCHVPGVTPLPAFSAHDGQAALEAPLPFRLAWTLKLTPWEASFCSEYLLLGHAKSGCLPWVGGAPS